MKVNCTQASPIKNQFFLELIFGITVLVGPELTDANDSVSSVILQFDDTKELEDALFECREAKGKDGFEPESEKLERAWPYHIDDQESVPYTLTDWKLYYYDGDGFRFEANIDFEDE